MSKKHVDLCRIKIRNNRYTRNNCARFGRLTIAEPRFYCILKRTYYTETTVVIKGKYVLQQV